MRAAIFLAGGLCWFGAALFLAICAWYYFTDAAGLQLFPLSISSGSVLVGLIHLLGFGFGAFTCFAIGVGLCAHGLVPPSRTAQACATHPDGGAISPETFRGSRTSHGCEDTRPDVQ